MSVGIFCRIIRVGLMVLYILNITTLINDLIESKYRLLDFLSRFDVKKILILHLNKVSMKHEK